MELLKAVEEWSDAEKIALLEREGGLLPDFSNSDELTNIRRSVELADQSPLGAVALRISRNEAVLLLNRVEEVRLLAQLTIGILLSRLTAMEKYLSSAMCTHCEWIYRDETPWPDPATDEEIDAHKTAAQERIAAAIREHVASCEKHPMRALERELVALRQAIAPPAT